MTPERTEKLLSVLNKRQPDIAVVLENVFDPHNISAVMRTCDAVGIQEIYVLNTKIPRHKKWGSKSSSSAAKWLTVHQFENAEECFKELRSKYSKIFTTHLSSGAIGLYEIDFTQSIALVFGNEHSGVSDEIRALADGNFIIPQVGIIQSLNISVACAVTIYEAYRQKEAAGHYNQRRLNDRQFDLLSKDWGF
jgi:tRNA (guanosine-2'-O-)-methyltransferase